MGKGSEPRPTNKKKFDSNFDRIFGEKDVMDFHRDKTCGLKISWPEVETGKALDTKHIVCTICGYGYTPGKNEPCSHIKKVAEECKDWIK